METANGSANSGTPKSGYGVAWNDGFKLGNEQVDAQHKRLFEVVSDLVHACQAGMAADHLQKTLNFLVTYTLQHFHDEEALQVKSRYPDYERHKQLHEDFKVTVGDLVRKFGENASPEELSGNVNKIVVRWLVNHIIREDKKIGEHIRRTGYQP